MDIYNPDDDPLLMSLKKIRELANEILMHVTLEKEIRVTRLEEEKNKK